MNLFSGVYFKLEDQYYLVEFQSELEFNLLGYTGVRPVQIFPFHPSTVVLCHARESQNNLHESCIHD